MAETSPSAADSKMEARTAQQESRHDVNRLKEDMEALRRDFSSIADTVRHMAMARGEQGRATIESYAQQARGQAEDYLDQAEGYVRANPLTSVGVALGIGWLIGRLMQRD